MISITKKRLFCREKQRKSMRILDKWAEQLENWEREHTRKIRKQSAGSAPTPSWWQ
jgi:hypothetical protein